MADRVRTDRAAGLAAPVSARVYEGRVARTHGPANPLVYPERPPQYQNEYRRMDELETIASALPGTPVIVLHPRRADGRAHLIREGAKPQIVGYVVGGRVDEDEHAVAKFVITHADGDAALARGWTELSLGYEATRMGDGYQSETSIDHLALVPRARCGATCRARTDGDCGCREPAAAEPAIETSCTCKNHAVESDHNPAPVAGAAKDTPHMDTAALQQKLTEALTLAATEKARADSLEQQLATANKVKADAAAETDRQRARADGAEAEAKKIRADAEAKMVEMTTAITKAKADAAASVAVESRALVQIMSSADRVLGAVDDKGKLIDRSALSQRQIMADIVKHVDGDDIAAGETDEYVRGRYQSALKHAGAVADNTADVRGAIVGARADALEKARVDAATGDLAVGPEAERAARGKMSTGLDTAWTAPKEGK